MLFVSVYYKCFTDISFIILIIHLRVFTSIHLLARVILVWCLWIPPRVMERAFLLFMDPLRIYFRFFIISSFTVILLNLILAFIIVAYIQLLPILMFWRRNLAFTILFALFLILLIVLALFRISDMRLLRSILHFFIWRRRASFLIMTLRLIFIFLPE
jgi:hypothetical protein